MLTIKDARREAAQMSTAQLRARAARAPLIPYGDEYLRYHIAVHTLHARDRTHRSDQLAVPAASHPSQDRPHLVRRILTHLIHNRK